MTTTPISKTSIATSKPLNLCAGLPIWQELKAFKAGAAVASSGGTFIKTKPQILWYKFGVEVSCGLSIGLCGPSFAIGMQVKGDFDDEGNITLEVEEDELQAGIVAGIELSAKAGFSLTEYHVFKGWKTDFDLEAKVDVDVVGILIDVIAFILKNMGGDIPSFKDFPEYGKYWGILGHASSSDGETLSKTGKITTTPSLSIKPNMVKMIETAFPVIKTISHALEKLGGDLDIGPNFWIGVPVTASISKVALGAISSNGKIVVAEYPVKFSDGKFIGKTTGQVPSKPKEMAVEISHTAGFDLGVGCHAEVSVLKIFSIGAELNWSLLEKLNIPVPHSHPYYDTLKNSLGSDEVVDCACSIKTSGLQVVLDPQTT